MRNLNAKDEYKPYGGRHRTHWIETPISIFLIHLILHRLYLTNIWLRNFCINLNLIYFVHPVSIFNVHCVNQVDWKSTLKSYVFDDVHKLVSAIALWRRMFWLWQMKITIDDFQSCKLMFRGLNCRRKCYWNNVLLRNIHMDMFSFRRHIFHLKKDPFVIQTASHILKFQILAKMLTSKLQSIAVWRQLSPPPPGSLT